MLKTKERKTMTVKESIKELVGCGWTVNGRHYAVDIKGNIRVITADLYNRIPMYESDCLSYDGGEARLAALPHNGTIGDMYAYIKYGAEYYAKTFKGTSFEDKMYSVSGSVKFVGILTDEGGRLFLVVDGYNLSVKSKVKADEEEGDMLLNKIRRYEKFISRQPFVMKRGIHVEQLNYVAFYNNPIDSGLVLEIRELPWLTNKEELLTKDKYDEVMDTMCGGETIDIILNQDGIDYKAVCDLLELTELDSEPVEVCGYEPIDGSAVYFKAIEHEDMKTYTKFSVSKKQWAALIPGATTEESCNITTGIQPYYFTYYGVDNFTIQKTDSTLTHYFYSNIECGEYKAFFKEFCEYNHFDVVDVCKIITDVNYLLLGLVDERAGYQISLSTWMYEHLTINEVEIKEFLAGLIKLYKKLGRECVLSWLQAEYGDIFFYDDEDDELDEDNDGTISVQLVSDVCKYNAAEEAGIAKELMKVGRCEVR